MALGPNVFSSSRQARELGSEGMGRTVWGRSYFLSLEHSLWGREHMHSLSEIRSDYHKVTKRVWVWPRLGTPVLVSSISWRLVFRSSPQLESFWVTVSLFSLQIYERKTLQAFLSCEHVFILFNLHECKVPWLGMAGACPLVSWVYPIL